MYYVLNIVLECIGFIHHLGSSTAAELIWLHRWFWPRHRIRFAPSLCWQSPNLEQKSAGCDSATFHVDSRFCSLISLLFIGFDQVFALLTCALIRYGFHSTRLSQYQFYALCPVIKKVSLQSWSQWEQREENLIEFHRSEACDPLIHLGLQELKEHTVSRCRGCVGHAPSMPVATAPAESLKHAASQHEKLSFRDHDGHPFDTQPHPARFDQPCPYLKISLSESIHVPTLTFLLGFVDIYYIYII